MYFPMHIFGIGYMHQEAMMKTKKIRRTTINLSDDLIGYLQKVHPHKTVTGLIHEALQNMKDTAADIEHFRKYSGKLKLANYE